MARNDMLSMIARTLSCQLSVRDNSPAQYSNAPQSRGLIVTLSIVSVFSPKRIVAILDIELPASMQQDSSYFDSYMDSENRACMRRLSSKRCEPVMYILKAVMYISAPKS